MNFKIGSYDWWCPVCGEQGAILGGAKPHDKITWARHGGGTSVCTKCVKNRREEIDKHNESSMAIGN